MRKRSLGPSFVQWTDDYLYNLKRGLWVCLNHWSASACVSVCLFLWVSVCNIPILEMVPKQNHNYTFKTMNPDGFNQFRMSCGPNPFCLFTQLRFTGSLDMDRVTAVFREGLNSFMSKRKSPLTTQMFTDLFNRFPVSAELRRWFQISMRWKPIQ